MENITVEELKARVDAGEKLNVLDVREPDEYAEYNIGGKLVPLGKIQSMQADEIDDWKDEEVIVHCRSGKRSVTAALFMEMQGFKNVKNLVGGVLAWQDKYANQKVH
ncbi:MAG TPA: rhodanese-like domain-containing protein [Chitinophagaceae bacterium]|nr:rhodanese-like domain-containing protein [Chitinophagaceae bacterium]